jgi:8-oxo-dGTP pyrophosphatase MutT (NUDIX family)
MTRWRPQPYVQVKALGLAWRGGRLLVGEVYGDDGRVKGVRPLGGAVEFGETWRAALVREFREELGAEVEVVGEPLVVENIYLHHGVRGHEVVFLAEVRVLTAIGDGAAPIDYREHDGTRGRAVWWALDALAAGGIALYPDGLMALLRGRGQVGDS